MLKLGIKKVLAVLLSVLFVVSLTAVAASANEGRGHHGYGGCGMGWGGCGMGWGGCGLGYGFGYGLGWGGCGYPCGLGMNYPFYPYYPPINIIV